MIVALALVGCKIESTEETTGPTWHQDVAPIVVEHCASCHTEGNIAPFALDSYGAARPMSTAIAAAVTAKNMPPWLAEDTPECTPPHPWVDDLRLSDEQIATLVAWSDAGAPEGDAATAAPLPAPPDLSVSNPDAVIPWQNAFTVQPTGKDQFQCFVLDLPNTEPMWVDKIQLVPGNPLVDHHGLVFLAAKPEEVAALPVGPDGSFECFNNPSVSGYLMSTWVPGASPTEMPADVGMYVPVGAKIIVQMHYHPSATAQEDLSQVELTWSADKPTYAGAQALLGNEWRQGGDGFGLQPGPNDRDGAEFRIPANVSGHTETMWMKQSIPYDFPVFSVGTHMHYVGTDMKIEIDHAAPPSGTPDTECLIQTPRWDFNWQRTYRYDTDLATLPKIYEGDTIKLTCTYDNTLDNPFVADALADQGLSEPQDVYLGESTVEEMCLGLFGFIVPSAFVDLLLE